MLSEHLCLDLPCSHAMKEDRILLSSEILFIELVYQKRTPRIVVHTSDDEYYSKIMGSMDSLEILLARFGFMRADSGILVNLNHFDHFEKDGFSQKICFVHSEKKVVCSRAGYSKVKNTLEKG